MKVEIDILNYNGAELLEECLPSVIAAAKECPYKYKLVVVDNCSVDNSEALVRDKFPEFYFYKTRENKVLCSLNEAAELSDADVMIFLNNDLKVDRHFIEPLINTIRNREGVFLSSARVYNFDGTDIEEGRTVPVLKLGVLRGVSKYDGFEDDLDKTAYTLQAGFGAFDRKKFLELGGYSTLYLPGILEDTDIGFRAWRRGYTCYYNPDSHIYHMGKVSFKKRFGNRKLLAISHRNSYFFIWKNIRDKRILLSNILSIPLRIMYAAITLRWEIIWGILWFVKCFPSVLDKRAEEMAEKGSFVMGDREVVDVVRNGG